MEDNTKKKGFLELIEEARQPNPACFIRVITAEQRERFRQDKLRKAKKQRKKK